MAALLRNQPTFSTPANDEEIFALVDTYTPMLQEGEDDITDEMVPNLFTRFTAVELEKLEIFSYFYNVKDQDMIDTLASWTTDPDADDELHQYDIRMTALLQHYYQFNTERMFNNRQYSEGYDAPIYTAYHEDIFKILMKLFNRIKTLNNTCCLSGVFCNIANFMLKSYQNFSLFYKKKYVNSTTESVEEDKEQVIEQYIYLIYDILNFVDFNMGSPTAFRTLTYREITDEDEVDHLLPHGEYIKEIIFGFTEFDEIMTEEEYEAFYDFNMQNMVDEEDLLFEDEEEED